MQIAFIVEDDPIFQFILGDHLKKKHNFTVFSFEDGEKCIDNMLLLPDVVLLDYHLNSKNNQAMNGLEVFKKIKQLNPDVKVIVLSGQDDSEIFLKLIKHGLRDYVMKNDTTLEDLDYLLEEYTESRKVG